MKDLLVGRITKVLDLERIAIEVTQVVRSHHFEYGTEEEVHIKVLKTNMMGILKRVSPNLFLEPRLSGSGVMCLVGARRASGCIEADVYVLDRNVRDEAGAA